MGVPHVDRSKMSHHVTAKCLCLTFGIQACELSPKSQERDRLCVLLLIYKHNWKLSIEQLSSAAHCSEFILAYSTIFKGNSSQIKRKPNRLCSPSHVPVKELDSMRLASLTEETILTNASISSTFLEYTPRQYPIPNSPLPSSTAVAPSHPEIRVAIKVALKCE